MYAPTIKVTSWHYRLAAMAGYNAADAYEHNICSYMRRVFCGFLLFTVLASLFCGFVFVEAHFLIALGFSILEGVNLFAQAAHPSLPVIIGTVINAIALVVVIGGGVIYLITDWANKRKDAKRNKRYADQAAGKEPETSFIVEAYHAWKNKYCLNLKFQTSDGEKINSILEERAKIEAEWLADCRAQTAAQEAQIAK